MESSSGNRQPTTSNINSPLVVDPGRVVVERVEQGCLELDLHGVVRLGALLLDVHDPAKAALADPLDVQEVVRTHLNDRKRENTRDQRIPRHATPASRTCHR